MTKQMMISDGKRYTYETLAFAPGDVFEEVLRRGTAPKEDDLKGWEFRGWNAPGSPVLSNVFVPKFKKGFYDPGPHGESPRGLIRGYNVQLKQDRNLMQPWVSVEKKGETVKHGWFEVYPARPDELDYRYPNALMLNYGCDKNPRLDPTRVLRDYLVQVYPDDPDLLLGKAYAAVGPIRLFLGFFLLGRENRSPLG